jgi:hypothetical protein
LFLPPWFFTPNLNQKLVEICYKKSRLSCGRATDKQLNIYLTCPFFDTNNNPDNGEDKLNNLGGLMIHKIKNFETAAGEIRCLTNFVPLAQTLFTC